MSRVRVRLHTANIHVEFVGREAVFGETIEPLILRAAGAGGARRPSPSATGPIPEVEAKEAAATPRAPASAPAPAGYQPPSQDFGTFRRQLHPEHAEEGNRIAAFAFFLWNYEKKEVFRADEVAGCFEADGRAVPVDADALYEDLVSRRILRPADEDGGWRLTSKGRAHVRHHLLSA